MIRTRIVPVVLAALFLLGACASGAEPTPSSTDFGEIPSIDTANPGEVVSRAEFAVFILKAMHGEDHQPLPAFGGWRWTGCH